MPEIGISISEYSQLSGLSVNQIYARIASGQIVAERIGTFKIFPEATKAHQLKLAQEKAERKAQSHTPRTRNKQPCKPSSKRRRVYPKNSNFLEELKRLERGG